MANAQQVTDWWPGTGCDARCKFCGYEFGSYESRIYHEKSRQFVCLTGGHTSQYESMLQEGGWKHYSDG